jgi:hypothetical protein
VIDMDKIVRTLDEEDLEDETVYTKKSRLHLVEDDELTPAEEAFMQGYEDAIRG